MKEKIFAVLQRVGRSFMLPIAILPVAGLLLGIGSSFTNATSVKTYGLSEVLGEGTVLNVLLMIMSKVGGTIFDNLPLLFAVGIAIGMAKREKEVAALSAVIAYLVMNVSINALLLIDKKVLSNGKIANSVLDGTVTSICGIHTLQMGVFGGVIVGLGVAALHNKFYKIQLVNALSFFGGTRFVPIISTITYMFVGILLYFIWPLVQDGIYALGGLISGAGYVGTLIFGLVKRALIPFGLHHVFYMPFWQTAVGGTMELGEHVVQGGQNIFFAQLLNSSNVVHFSADATRYFSGEFIFMIFGLPGAALAMYHCAKTEKKKAAGGLLLSASLTCIATGITEPLEFSFLFVAPLLFIVHVVLAGSAYMIAHMLNIAVGMTFSGGFLDLFLYGILQGNEKTSWLLIIPVGIVYFFLYYFIFKLLIKKFNLKTPGREEDEVETKLYTQEDVDARKAGSLASAGVKSDNISAEITRGLGGKKNISDIDCCATRLRCTVKDASLVNEVVLKATGASGVMHRGTGVQVIYGPNVTVIKSDLEDYLAKAPNTLVETKREMPAKAIDKNRNMNQNLSGMTVVKTVTISSPVNGIAADLATALDQAFAEKMMGEGAVVTPTDAYVYAPENGVVAFVFQTKHAIGFLTDSGISLLIHMGIDTVNLNGVGFEALVTTGQKVRKGQPMLKLDLEYIRKNATSLNSPILCTELKENQKVRLVKEGKITAGEALMEIDFYE